MRRYFKNHLPTVWVHLTANSKYVISTFRTRDHVDRRRSTRARARDDARARASTREDRNTRTHARARQPLLGDAGRESETSLRRRKAGGRREERWRREAGKQVRANAPALNIVLERSGAVQWAHVPHAEEISR